MTEDTVFTNSCITANCSSNTTLCTETSCKEQAFNQTLKLVLDTVLPASLALMVLTMGCTTDIHKLWGHIRRPWGILLGFICQFGIMPLTAFSLSMALNVQLAQAMAIIIMGCCPGGSLSNIFAYWLDGDMDLSISMTTCSTILAMGMMPLCLLIYTSPWISSDTIQIPYNNIGMILAMILVPVSAGIYIKHQWSTAAKKIIKVGSVVSLPVIITLTVVGCIMYKKAWIIAPSLWVIGILFPMLGYSFGFLLARMARQPWYRCRTIALETGIQNCYLCSTIMQLSFTMEEMELVFAFPLIYAISQIVFSLVALGGYMIYKHCYQRNAVETATSDGKRVLALENSGFCGDKNSNDESKVTKM